MIYSFSNTTSCATFYAFFSSFRITLWPMWPANSKRQPCFYPPQSQAQEDTQNDTRKPDGKTVLCQRIFSSFFRAVFYTDKLHSLTQIVGAFHKYFNDNISYSLGDVYFSISCTKVHPYNSDKDRFSVLLN